VAVYPIYWAGEEFTVRFVKEDDFLTNDIDEALDKVLHAKKNDEALSVGLVGNAGEILPEILERDIIPDVLTDQTSAHDTLNGYVPMGMSFEEALILRKDNPSGYIKQAKATIVTHVNTMLAFQKKGAITFDYGNNIRGEARDNGVKNAFDIRVKLQCPVGCCSSGLRAKLYKLIPSDGVRV